MQRTAAPRLTETGRNGPMLYNLEALRGICALMVAVFHVPWWTPLHGSPPIQNAWLFVDFFFVLSGFIIARTYADSGRQPFDARGFVIKRLSRLYPLHVATTLAFLALVLAKQFVLPAFTSLAPRGPLPDDFGIVVTLNLLLLHAMSLLPTAYLNAPSWSIAAEFWTYCIFCLCCLASARPAVRVLLMTVIGGVALTALLVMNGEKGLWTTYQYGLMRCLACFGIGTLAWAAAHWRPMRLVGPAADLAFLVLGGALYIFMSGVSMQTRLNALAPLLFAAIIYLAAMDAGSHTRKLLEAAPMRALGRWSYSIYMVHFMIATALGVLLERVWPERIDVGQIKSLIVAPAGLSEVLLFGYLALTVALSAATYAWIERPWRDRGRRLAARQRDDGAFQHVGMAAPEVRP